MEEDREVVAGEEGRLGADGADNRFFVDAVLWIHRTGAPWRDLPERFGLWNSVWRRFRRWCAQGVWEQLIKELGHLDLEELQLDSTSIKVPVSGSNGRRQAGEKKKLRMPVVALVDRGAG